MCKIELFKTNATEILINVGLRPDLLSNMVDGLTTYYTTNRYYHDVRHINLMLSKMNEANWQDDDLAFAILLHDVYYKPGCVDNEKRSAIMAEDILRNCPECHSLVSPMILETANFMAVSKHRGDCFYKICDLDLCSLAKESYDSFVQQQKDVLKELEETDLSKSANFLVDLLKKRGEYLYYTDYANHNWKDRAINNITRFHDEFGS